MALTLTANIAATAPSLLVTGSVTQSPGFRFRVDDELFDLSGFEPYPMVAGKRRVGLNSNHWRVNRGVGGSVAASHNAGATIYGALSASVSASSEALPDVFAEGSEAAVAASGVEVNPAVLGETDVQGALEALAAGQADIPAAADTIGLTRLRKIRVSWEQFVPDPDVGAARAPLYELQVGDWLFMASIIVTTAFNDTAVGPVAAVTPTPYQPLSPESLIDLPPTWGNGIPLVNADQGTDAEVYSVQDPHLPVTPIPAGSPAQLYISTGLNGDGTAGVMWALLWVNEFTARGLGVRMDFGQQPTAVVTGVAISPSPTVRVLKDDGTVDTSDQTTQITVSLANESVGGAVLGGTLTRTVVNGVATFPGLTVDVAEDVNILATADNECGLVKSATITVSAP